jgi:hypothetical protein
MSDWYKIYNVAEECGITGSTSKADQDIAIKTWLEENF